MTLMPKMTKEELAKRKREMTDRARAEVAKTEIVQFRADAEVVQKLYAHAARLRMPVGAMVRQWVMNQLSAEESGGRNDIASIHARLDRFEKILLNEKVGPSRRSSTTSVRSREKRAR
jgi:hypothetical protein